jgi:hypothetical protein
MQSKDVELERPIPVDTEGSLNDGNEEQSCCWHI